MVKLVDVPRYEAVIEAIKKAKKDVEKAKYKLRNLALISILTFSGCRLGEALKLKVEDIDVKNRTIRIVQEKKKKNFIRIIPIPSKQFWDIMERYIKTIPFKSMLLFPITDRQARNIVYSFSQKYLKTKIRPHALRHSYATFILKKTKDIEATRRLLGHSNYKTLKEYLEYTQEDLEETLFTLFRDLE